jgi:type II secretory pathway predicted ATPase ExeA/septal ring-binding cell division protein DamX
VSLNNQDTDFKQVLGLQKDPFSPEPDPAFYYAFDSFEQRLKVLRGLVQGTDILVLIIGEPGSGKTTLLNRYLAAAEGQWKSVRILTDPDTASPRTTDTLDRGGYPAYVLQDSENPIVIVDDSHKLPQKELEFLLQEALVPGGTNKIKRLVLCGESDLHTRVTRIATTYTVQPAVNKIYLPGLTEMQTGAYLQHRLAAAGYTGKNPFNSSAVKDIHQTSGGYPGAVNEIANQWLRVKYSTQEEGQSMLQHFSTPLRRVAVWIAAGVIIFLLAVFWYLPGRKPAVSKPPDQTAAKKVFRQKITQNHPPAETVVRKKITLAKAATPSPAEIKTPQPEASKTPPPEAIKTPQPEAIKTPQPEAIKTSPQPPPEIKTQQTAKAETALAEPAVAAPVKEAPLQKIQIQPAPLPAAPSTSATPGTIADKGAVQREKWLLSQDAASYTIQIMGVHNEQSIFEFIEKNQLLQQNEIAYYESTFQGKAWYQLLYGLYPTRQAAELAANNLPENIRRAGPWIRKMAGIQKTIKDRG